jgi:hypothetical protein
MNPETGLGGGSNTTIPPFKDFPLKAFLAKFKNIIFGEKIA